MSKRRNINLLPPVYQTEELKRFFGSTVDQLFQPGTTDLISGYIGRKPSYYDAAKDFYKVEATQERTDRQLEPAVVSLDSNGEVSKLVFYDDFVNHLRASGSPTESMDRLLASQRYSWAPPIDLDKLVNFHNYYWVGSDITPTSVTPPSITYTAGPSQLVYTLPAAISTWGGAPDSVVVSVNNNSVVNFTVAGGNVILGVTPATGASVKITRYADLISTITGMETAINPATGLALSSGQYLHIHDAVNNGMFWIEGVGRSISFIADIENYTGDRPYVVIDRTCKSRNVWSRRNRWAHKAVLPDMAITTAAQASRPIIEFEPEMILFNYGTYRIDPITCTLTNPAIKAATSDIPQRAIGVSDINGSLMGSVTVDNGHVLVPGDRLLVRQVIPSWTPKTFFAANAVVNHAGNTYRCTISHVSGVAWTMTNWADDPLSSINNQIFLIEEVVDGVTSVYGLALQTDSAIGAVTQLNSSDIEYWFDGSGWPIAQPFASSPLFDLFDKDGVSFSNTEKYLGANFDGSKIFSYAIGAGSTDTFIGQALKYNEYGQIVFENQLSTIPLIANGVSLDVERFYAFDRDGVREYDNSWHQNSEDIQLFEGSIPINLQANPDNETPDFISRNQWFDHFSQLITAQDGFVGEPYSTNNWRDTARNLGLGRSILQHNASMIRPMILASDDTYNVIDATIFARNEYETFIARFVRRFDDLLNSGAISQQSTVASWVDSVLANLIVTKQSDYAFALSRMAGGQYFIPPSPSYLGLLPVYTPGRILRDGVNYIQGHDGSLRPVFGDHKDEVILELENRIYASVNSNFKNEDSGFSFSEFVGGYFHTILDSQFTRDEFLAVLSSRFENWCHTKSIDYRSNDLFSPEDPFTWNYSSIKDSNGRYFDGNWRGIYRYLFGTDRPHLAPWEMLGFGDKPSWWENSYGPAPYTSGNQQMWSDIQDGRILHGPRAGISLLHMRSGLLPVYAGSSVISKGVLPVDESGALLDPISAHIVPYAPPVVFAQKDWKFGDGAEVETLWMQTAGYRFDFCTALYLLRPIVFIERGWNSLEEVIGPNGQPISTITGKRPRMVDMTVHGERINGVNVVGYGIQQWISDYLITQGRNVSILGDILRNSEVRLAHRVAGFTTFDNLSVTADNFGIIPLEDIQIKLHQSQSSKEEFYSGIVVEWTGLGYRVYGFDPANTFFPVLSVDEFGKKTRLLNTQKNDRSINPWQASTYFATGSLVSYDGFVYGCRRSHTSGPRFETAYWELQPAKSLPDASVLFAPKFSMHIDHVPYGTVLNSRQEVVNLILGYGAYLRSHGWVFESSQDTGVTDWMASARSFANWSALSWDAGYFIALSPAARTVTFESAEGTILNVEQSLNGFYGIYDRNGQPIPREVSAVSRSDDQAVISAGDADIFGARVRIADVEHAIVFSNETIFGDIIYQPLYNLRQPRLKVSLLRAGEWKGRFDAPGYLIVDGEIKPSFEKSAENMRTMFDIEQADDPILRDYARHIIGFQKRDYLTNLNLSDTQQFEFYQGLIQNKGSVSAFDRLLRSNIIGQNRNLSFREEWAVRVGDYGANNPFDRWEIEVRKDDILNQNQFFYFNENLDRDNWTNLQLENGRWVTTPQGKSRSDFVFSTTSNANSKALPTAGYVRLNDVSYTVRYLSDLQTKLNDAVFAGDTIAANQRVWVMDDGIGGWSVYKLRYLSATGASNTISSVVPDQSDVNNPFARLYSVNPTGLTSDDVGRFVVFLSDIDTLAPISGCFQITTVNTSDDSFGIDASIFDGVEYDGTTSIGPQFCILEKIRFGSMAERVAVPSTFWQQDDYVYVDDAGNGLWTVYQYDGSNFIAQRFEGARVENEKFMSTALFHLGTEITTTQLAPQPSILDHIALIDPKIGAMAGVADREISYKLEYDPAIYFGDNAWGVNELGKIWWDLSAVRFLEPYTDDLERTGITASQFSTEIEYRINNWSKIAPETSVDVYEWVRSEILPEQWTELETLDPAGTYAGQPYLGIDAPYVVQTEFSPRYNAVRTYYYYWVKNRLTVPSNPDRNLSSYATANIITNPSNAGLVWVAPISKYGMLFSNAAEYLDNIDTILQMDFTANPYEGAVHHQWSLIRIGDEESKPPVRVWTKIVDSIIGFDKNLSPIPDPALHSSVATGALDNPKQNVFSARNEDIRLGIGDARKSFVEMINYILARHDYASNRIAEINDLFVESPLTARFAWVQADNSSYVEPLPPSSEYDIEVFSVEERDAILTTRRYNEFLTPSPWDKAGWDAAAWDADVTISPRILLNSLNESRPSWSVWEIDLETIPENATIEQLNDLAPQIIIPARMYDHEVTSIAARDALPDVKSGDRILVRDITTSDFWTIWAYFENASSHYNAGFNLVNAQRYRVSDFISRADWYADGYDDTHPPVVRYRNITERDISERDHPSSVFVQVDNDGDDNWMWTVYDRTEGSWNVVARQNGTIQLSERFFDTSRPIYGWNGADGSSFNIEDVSNRDGSFELRLIIRMLQDKGLINNLEINELFFSILHFIHSQQDQVDWIIPTSYMSVIGYKEPLSPSAIAKQDNIDTILQYLDEVKPYRVKTREFVRGMISDDDSISGRVTDFSKPVYYDVDLRTYRPLRSSSADQEILSTIPWADWSADPASSNVPSISGTITYDRLWPNLSEGDASGAAKYIDLYYQPTEIMKEKSLSTLLNLDFKGTIVDGRKVVDDEVREEDVRIVGVKRSDADVAINGASELKFSFSFQDAMLSANKPEELCTVKADDSMVLSIFDGWGTGVPSQRLMGINTANSTGTTLVTKLDYLPQNKDNISVFQDGVHIDNNSVEIDVFTATVSVPLIKSDQSRASTLAIRSIGYGSTTNIISQKFLISDGALTIPISIPANSKVILDVDGVNRDDLVISHTTSSITLSSAPTVGAKIVITLLANNGNRYSQISTVLAYTSSKSWSYSDIGASNPIQHTAVIVEKNGIRLRPPRTYYGSFGLTNRGVTLDFIPSSFTIEVWLNGVLDNSKTTLIDGVMTPNSPSYMCDDVRVVVRGDQEFDLVNDALTVTTMNSNDTLKVIGFANNAGMNTRTMVSNGISTGEYLLPAPLDQNYVWVTVNGKLALEGYDYLIEPIVDAYDTLPKDITYYDSIDSRRKFKFLAGHLDTDIIVVTTFGTNAARPPAIKQLSTKLRSTSRHIDNKLNVSAWEYNVLSYEQKGGILTARFDQTSTSINIQANPSNLPVALIDSEPFATPDIFAKKPGVIWISGERIEYFELLKNGSNYTLSQLRRGTHNTFISNFYSVGEPVYSANTQSTNLDRIL